ncbi:CPBP family intramembrane metalloprotease, partial [bacterium]|nr:CPBP family intramembrane metalloprotease [bacterium]
MNLDNKIPVKSLIPFFFISFAIAWGILGLYITFPEFMKGHFGQLTGQHPLFFLAVYAPAIAALSIIIYSTGIRGIRSYFYRLLLWRTSKYWWLFIVIGVPCIFFAGSLRKGNFSTYSFPFKSMSLLIVALFFTLIKGPIEELGWGGFALPLLQRKLSPIWAALILGVIWGLWHFPAFLLSGTQQSAWSFTPFFIGSIAISIITTALFNTSHGSILLPALMHFQLNNPIWPDAQPYDILIFAIVAIFVIKVSQTFQGTIIRSNDL